jgi:hypothetical protein
LNWPRAGLIVFFMPAVWQVYTGKPTLFLDFLWDDCELNSLSKITQCIE